MTVRFLHTGDWQLGVRRTLLSPEAQVRYSEARLAAVERIGALAAERGASFVVVAGDVFESNQVDRRTLGRAFEAVKQSAVAFYLLPGNHDPLDATSIYASEAFKEAPDTLHVLRSPAPVEVEAGIELVGAPWFSKRPAEDLASAALEPLGPKKGGVRILLAHGAIDVGHPKPQTPYLIRQRALEAALESGVVRYVALGDRHSRTAVGETGRIWYAGTPEPTAFRETDPGWVLEVTLDGDAIEVEPLRVGRWRFLERSFELTAEDDLDRLESELDEPDDKRSTVLRLALDGHLPLRAGARLAVLVERARDLYAAIDLPGGEIGSVVSVPDAVDREALGVSGFAATAVESLLDAAQGEGESARSARDALALLYRLAAADG